jgi:hypothetical protein
LKPLVNVDQHNPDRMGPRGIELGIGDPQINDRVWWEGDALAVSDRTGNGVRRADGQLAQAAAGGTLAKRILVVSPGLWILIQNSESLNLAMSA